MDVYLINLDRDFERLEFISNSLDNQSVDYKRVAAVDGSKLSSDFVSSFRINSKRSSGWLVGQIGCFLSHRKCWEYIANSESEYSLILEDDLHLSDDLKSFIYEDLTWIPDNADIVRLETSTNWLKVKKVSLVYGRTLYSVHSDSWLAGSYIISRACAQRLLDVNPTFWMPTDFFLFAKSISSLASDLNIYQILPALSCQDKYASEFNSIDILLGLESNIEEFSESKRNFYSKRISTSVDVLKKYILPYLGYEKSIFKN